MEKGLSVGEFNRRINESLSGGDYPVDRMIDDMTAKIGRERDHVVFDSRLAWHFVPESFKVFIMTDLDEAARRVFHDSTRSESESYESWQECRKALVNRQKFETVRYMEIYGIDYYRMGNYNLVLDSTDASPQEVASEIMDRMEDYQNGEFHRIVELNPSSIRWSDGNTFSGADIEVVENEGVFTLRAGGSCLDRVVASGRKFVPVRVTVSGSVGENGFMDFSGMSE